MSWESIFAEFAKQASRDAKAEDFLRWLIKNFQVPSVPTAHYD